MTTSVLPPADLHFPKNERSHQAAEYPFLTRLSSTSLKLTLVHLPSTPNIPLVDLGSHVQPSTSPGRSAEAVDHRWSSHRDNLHSIADLPLIIIRVNHLLIAQTSSLWTGMSKLQQVWNKSSILTPKIIRMHRHLRTSTPSSAYHEAEFCSETPRSL